MIDKDEIIAQWNRDRPIYENWGGDIVAFFISKLHEYEIHPEVTYRTKEIWSIIKKIEKKAKEKEYTYSDLTDKLGIRIICSFAQDLDKVDAILKEYFVIRKQEYKKNDIDFNKLDYQSNHYDVSINKDYFKFQDEDFVFEIQVRTINQHAWANSAHILYYKQDIVLPDEMKRRIYRLLSLYEIADEEFAKVNEYIMSEQSNSSYALLKKLEGKFYKYANVDFDREFSLMQLDILLGFFNETIKNELSANIEEFIAANDEKIQHIFNDNRSRYDKLLFLTQPEVFVIWYFIENYRAKLNDIWSNRFDEEDLVNLENLW